MEPIYYASGTNKAGEIRGMARAGRDLGVAAPDCLSRGSKSGIRCEDALVRVAETSPELRVFVDSGAFSEVSDKAAAHKLAGLKPQEGVLKVVKPITEAQWVRRLGLMERVGKAYGSRLLVMAPDKIADQQETLRRLRWFRSSGWLERVRRTGAEIAVVLQGGKLDPVAFEREAAKALGWSGYVVAFPMARGATPLPVVKDYMQRRLARRVHLLGIGPKARKEKTRPSGAMVQRELFDTYPRVQWSWDSALIRQSVSRDPKKIARGKAPYTAAQDIERADLIPSAWEHMDFTELGSTPSVWLLDLWGWPKASKCIRDEQAKKRQADTPAGRRAWLRRKAKWDKCRAVFEAEATKTANALGVPPSERQLFIYDPDGYSYSRYPNLEDGWGPDNPRYVTDAYYAATLEAEFGRWLGTPFKKGGPPEVSELLAELATYRAFREGGLPDPGGGQKRLAGLGGAGFPW